MPRPTLPQAARGLLAFSLLLAPALAAPLSAQVFEDFTQVTEVQVPVNVTRRDGTPVRGLTAADFTVYDRGRRQELTDFQVIDLEVLQPAGPQDPAPAPIPAAARRHFLLLFDLTFSSPSSVVRARLAARDFVLATLHPTDLAAVATYSLETGTRLLVTFTPDRAQLARAIDTLGAPRLLDPYAKVDPLRFMIEDPAVAAAARDFGDTGSGLQSPAAEAMQQAVLSHLNIINKQIERSEKSFERGKAVGWLRGLQETAKALRTVEGAKHVVLFSEGFDGRLMLGRGPDGQDLAAQIDQQHLQFGRYWMVDTDDIYGNSALQADARDVLEEFRRAGCAIQAVDISGLRAGSAENERAHSVGQDVLFYLANETGGVLFEDANDFHRQLEGVIERSSVTYLLSFRPAKLEADGAFHPLRVEARTPEGSQVSHRAGYYAPRPFQDLHPLEKNLITSDAIAAAAPRRDLDLNVLAAAFRSGGAKAYVPVIVEMSGSSLLAGHDGSSLPVEIYVYASDAQGEMKDFFTHLVTLDIAQGRRAMSQSGLKYYGHVDLEPGDYLLRVLVRNAATGHTGVETLPVEVPHHDGTDPVILPPFFFDSSQWTLVRERGDGPGQKSVVYPFTVKGQIYVPAAEPVLTPNDRAALCLVAYNLAAADVVLEARVRTRDGDEIDSGSLALVERTVTGIPGLDKFLATFQPGDLGSGHYVLEVAVRQPVAGVLETTSIPFSVIR